MRKSLLIAVMLALITLPAAAQDARPEMTAEITPEPTAETTAEPELTFPEPGSYTVRQPYNDVERRYRVTIPESYDGTEAVPLVLVLHGAGGTAAGIEAFTGFNDLAESENFVVVYPDGAGNVWNDGRTGDLRINPVDDVQFLSDVVTVMQSRLNIDARRVYATGYSMGGMMSYRLGCERGDLFAAVGSVASTMPYYLISTCNDSEPIPVIVFQGTDDPVVPWTGVSGAYLSTAQTIGYWGSHNQCDQVMTMDTLPDGETQDYTVVIRQTMNNCAADVVVYGIYLGGHTWPGRPFNAGGLAATSRDIDATLIMWEFFAAHPQPAE